MEVIGILKGLLSDGEMLLIDGRRILSSKNYEQYQINKQKQPSIEQHTEEEKIIQIHDKFRIIILGNKQGYPFLGNNLLKEIGDCCSYYFITNPTIESELILLNSIAPSLNEEIKIKLIKLFNEIRKLVDEGLINYPYSTRELIQLIKHLNSFPEDGLVESLNNIFSFDEYNYQFINFILSIFHKFNIPLFNNFNKNKNTKNAIFLSNKIQLNAPILSEFWNYYKIFHSAESFSFINSAEKLVIENQEKNGNSNSWEEKEFLIRKYPIEKKGSWKVSEKLKENKISVSNKINKRMNEFTEEIFSFKLKKKGEKIIDFCIMKNSVFLLLNDPLRLVYFIQSSTGPLSAATSSPFNQGESEFNEYVEIPLFNHLRYSSMPSLNDFPFKCFLVPLPLLDSVLFYVPNFEAAILINILNFT